jgi:nitrogen regulatory protein PII
VSAALFQSSAGFCTSAKFPYKLQQRHAGECNQPDQPSLREYLILLAACPGILSALAESDRASGRAELIDGHSRHSRCVRVEMKRIEAIITPWSLDEFKETAPELGIAEFELVEVYRSGCETIERSKRFYRGQEFNAGFSPRLRVEFIMFDDDVQAAVHQLLERVHPESISVFRVDQEARTLAPATSHLKTSGSSRLTNTPETAAPANVINLASVRHSTKTVKSNRDPLQH